MPEWLVAALLLAAALACFGVFQRRDLIRISTADRADPGRYRRARYRRWVLKSWVLFALPAMLLLALVGRADAVLHMPPEFLPASQALVGSPVAANPDLLLALGGGLAGGLLVSALLTRRTGKSYMLGDIGRVLPRNRGELRLSALMAVSAGVTEELYFRLLLPLLATIATGSVGAGFLLAIALFGYAHRYQGWSGIAATTVMGLFFSWLYLATHALWLAMAVHCLTDLMSLVVRPMMTGALRRD